MDSPVSDPIHGPASRPAANPPAPGPQATDAFQRALLRAQGSERLPHQEQAAGASDPRSEGKRKAAKSSEGGQGPPAASTHEPHIDGQTQAESQSPHDRALSPSLDPDEGRPSKTRSVDLGDPHGGVEAAGVQVHQPDGGAEAAVVKAPQSTPSETPRAPLPASGAAVLFPDPASPLSELEVSVLADGAVDLLLTVTPQAEGTVSDALDRLKRRLEAKGVSVAGIQLNTGLASAAVGRTSSR